VRCVNSCAKPPAGEIRKQLNHLEAGYFSVVYQQLQHSWLALISHISIGFFQAATKACDENRETADQSGPGEKEPTGRAF
jgi:hypothetical protein